MKVISASVPFEVAVTPDPIKLMVVNKVPIPTPSSFTVRPDIIPVKLAPEPKNDVAVTLLIPEILVALSPIILPFAFTFPETVVTPVTFRLEKVGVSVNVTVAPTPDALAVKLELTKLISPTLPAKPTTDPSSLTVKPLKAPT